MKNKKILFVLLILGVTGVSFAADHPSKKIYDTKCASCHGKDLKGNATMAKVFKVEPAMLDLASAATAGKTDEDLIKVTSKGLGKMPSYEKSLKAEEIKGLVSYIRSVTPAKPVAVPATETPAAK